MHTPILSRTLPSTAEAGTRRFLMPAVPLPRRPLRVHPQAQTTHRKAGMKMRSRSTVHATHAVLAVVLALWGGTAVAASSSPPVPTNAASPTPLASYAAAGAAGRTNFSVSDRAAILNLVQAYALAYDNFDADSWFELFTPDAIFVVGVPGAAPVVQSGDAFRKFWRDRLATFKASGNQRRHLMSNITFLEQSDTTVHASVVGLLTNVEDRRTFSVATSLNYEAWFEKEGGVWKIKRWHDFPDSSPEAAKAAPARHAMEQRRVRSGSAVLDVRIVGTGKPLVLVPGFARGAADFAEIMQGLAARGYRAIAINARGCEGSTGPWAKTTLHEIADDLHAVVEDLGIGPVHVAGHAAGGRYARMLATRHPESVKSVILLSSGGQFEDKERFATFLGAVMKNIAGDISPAEMDAAMLASGAFASGNDPSPWRTGWWPVATAQAKGGEHVKAEEYSKAGGRPMLALYGKEDGVAPPRNSLALKEALGGQVTVMGIDRAAHNMLQEQPAAIIEAIDAWIKAESPR
ncbi:MAG: hypothetical protein RJA99_916 [Pseudomonadota bacterium]|jgi:pimeloyl-ACP methyl ester carboxylesterase/ketosteroid isomerase-like protein